MRALPLTSVTIWGILDDVCDNLFNPDHYKQRGGNSLRADGMIYSRDRTVPKDSRIAIMTLNGKPAATTGAAFVVRHNKACCGPYLKVCAARRVH